MTAEREQGRLQEMNDQNLELQMRNAGLREQNRNLRSMIRGLVLLLCLLTGYGVTITIGMLSRFELPTTVIEASADAILFLVVVCAAGRVFRSLL